MADQGWNSRWAVDTLGSCQPGVYCTGFYLCGLVTTGRFLLSHILISQKGATKKKLFGTYMYKYAYFKGGTPFVGMQKGTGGEALLLK